MFRVMMETIRTTFRHINTRSRFGGIVVGATVIALTDEQLKKKPLWYQTDVRRLAFAIKYTDRKGYLDDVVLLENLRQKLVPYADTTNTDILWRYARVLLEIGLWTSSADKNRMKTLFEAEKLAKKAVDNDNPLNPCAEAHKWYGITLVKLTDFRSEKKLDEALKHLERAVELDSSDARSWQYLGIVQYMQKNYKDALHSHEVAESLQPGFSNENLLWLGKAELALGRKKEACENFLKAKTLTPRYRSEYKVGILAREILLKNCKMRPDDIPDSSTPY